MADRRLRRTVEGFAPYTPIEPAAVLAARHGVPPDHIVKLDANENPYGPVPGVARLLERTELVAEYPDPLATAAREALAAYTGVPASSIVLGNGSDELIDLVCRAVLERGGRAVSFPPTFGMYRFYAELAEATVTLVERDDRFGIPPVEAIRAAEGAALVMLASPNNPSGNRTDEALLRGLLETGTLVLVDEAYYEFSGQSVMPWLAAHENLVVLRTFSKWAGLAGLRIGYGAFPDWLAEAIRRIKTPYNVNAVAQAAVVATLDDLPTARQRVAALMAERPRLVAAVEATGLLRAYPSEANFVLFEVLGLPAAELKARLTAHGVFVRHFDEPRLRNCLRISVGTPDQTLRLTAALQAIRDQG